MIALAQPAIGSTTNFQICPSPVPAKPAKTLFAVSAGPSDHIQKNSVDGRIARAYPEQVAKKEATGFGSPIYTWRTTALGGIFSSVPRRAFNERRWLGGLRLPVSVCTGLPTFLSLLTPFGSGLCGSPPHTEAIMPGTTTPPNSPASAKTLTVDQIFQTAFHNGRTPRSVEYQTGTRAALAFRIERIDFEMPYQVGTAAADAYFSGITEGHALWRAAVAKIGGAA